MNFTIANTTLNNTWKHIRLPYVATTCALALAVGVLVSAGGLFNASSAPARGLTRAVSTVQPDQTRPQTTFILVDTLQQEDEANQFLFEHNTLMLSGHQELPPYEIVFTGTAAEANLLNAMAASWGEYALNARLIDLRGR